MRSGRALKHSEKCGSKQPNVSGKISNAGKILDAGAGELARPRRGNTFQT
jgi:hypothetical protein